MASSLERLEKQYAVEIHWRSFELRPAGAPPLSPQYRARIEASRPLLQKRAREEYGLEINAGPLGITSRPALIAQKYAEAEGKGAAFHRAVMEAYWQHARSIDDPQVLKEIAEQVGLRTEDFEAALVHPAFDAEVAAEIKMAQEYGIDAVPALVFAEQYLVVGAQPYPVLQQVVEKLQAE